MSKLERTIINTASKVIHKRTIWKYYGRDSYDAFILVCNSQVLASGFFFNIYFLLKAIYVHGKISDSTEGCKVKQGLCCFVSFNKGIGAPWASIYSTLLALALGSML